MLEFKDQIGRIISIPQKQLRIVSLVPSITELLVDLGLRENLVGITKFCVHPENLLKEKKVVGGTKSIHFTKINKLQPDIIICNKEENTTEMVAELEKKYPVYVSNIITIEHSLALILDLGRIFNVQEQSEKLRLQLQEIISKFQRNVFTTPKRVAYFIWRNPWMVVGNNTFINSLLEINGWTNIYFPREERYPEVDLEELNSLQPDTILLSNEPFPFSDKHILEMEKFTKAKIILVNGEMFSWYGSRMLKAFPYFEKLQATLQ